MRKFNRVHSRRKLFMKSLANSLITYGRMETTVARAKEVRPMVERLVSVAKKQEVSSLRRLLAVLPKKAAGKLYYDIAPRYKDRNGGFLRITKETKFRKRDGAPLAVVEFV